MTTPNVIVNDTRYHRIARIAKEASCDPSFALPTEAGCYRATLDCVIDDVIGQPNPVSPFARCGMGEILHYETCVAVAQRTIRNILETRYGGHCS